MNTETTSPNKDNSLELADVKLWSKRLKDAETYFQKDFVRMRDNMKFAAGLQREGQDSIDCKEYTANFVNREVQMKVSTLYAKDPKAVYKRRPRLDFQIWDESVESMQDAHALIGQAMQNPALQQSPQFAAAQALINDITTGKKWQALCDRIGRSMEILYQYQCDTQSPDFKYQMKQLVRRVVITGVGFVRMNFSRQGDHALTSSGTDDSLSMRLKRARSIMAQIDDDQITEDDPRRQQLEELFASVEQSSTNGDITNIEEKIDFDFPSATSILVDPRCKSLKGFVGARWVAQKYVLPVEDVNAYFELTGDKAIKAGGDLVTYARDGVEKKGQLVADSSKDPQEKSLCCLYEVFDLTTKSVVFLVNGWKMYVQEPQPLTPNLKRFWPIFSLTFNDIETEEGMVVHVYPPSDVELIKHPQKELNRQREELKKQRIANRPWYGCSEGLLTSTDLDAIGNHQSNQLISFKGIPPGTPISQVIERFASVPIDPALYESDTVLKDSKLVIGSNTPQTSLSHVAATPAVIQEQARSGGVNSNVDDLDDLLREMAFAGGEITLQEFSLATVKRIVGVGAVWPEQNRQDFLNEIYLDVVAASSGRPNKAVDVANAQQVGPLMAQAGANPWALIKYYCKVLDSDLDPLEFAPVTPPMPPQMPGQGQAPAGAPNKPPGMVGQHLGGTQPVAVQRN
jgi:hypothetical protein